MPEYDWYVKLKVTKKFFPYLQEKKEFIEKEVFLSGRKFFPGRMEVLVNLDEYQRKNIFGEKEHEMFNDIWWPVNCIKKVTKKEFEKSRIGRLKETDY